MKALNSQNQVLLEQAVAKAIKYKEAGVKDQSIAWQAIAKQIMNSVKAI